MKYENKSKLAELIRYLTEVSIGGLVRIADIFIKTKPKHWIFGADYGYSYRESSKYMIEYMIEKHPEFKCTFITNNERVKTELDSKGIPCVLNNSLNAIRVIAEADVVFMTQYMTDIRYAFKKKNRSYYYFSHGQPYKKCMNALPKPTVSLKETLKSNFFKSFGKIFSCDYQMSDIELVPATSDFLKPYMELLIGNNVSVDVLGMPRNDRLFDKKRMESENWIKGVEGKKIVTYMPTHRQYGKGEVTPLPFKDNHHVQEWFRKNNVVFVMKQHPNMMWKIKDEINNDVFKDITKQGIDPQVVLYHSDVLISDFSSVFIDYLLFKRPTLFYIYDNYTDIEGNLYDITCDFPTTFCYTEDELFECIKKAILTPEIVTPSDNILSKYNKYIDGKSCERFFEAVVRRKYK